MAFGEVELVAAADGDSGSNAESNSAVVSDKVENSEPLEWKTEDNGSISAQGGSKSAACVNQSSTSNSDISGR